MSLFNHIPIAPPDSIFGVATSFNASPLTKKEILSVGVYQTEEGKPYVFPAVAKAEDRIIHKYFKNYLPMEGHPGFIEEAQKLLWGPVYHEIKDRLASIQSAAGTGGLFITSRFAKEHLNFPCVMISDPAWPNYLDVFGRVGHKLYFYPWVKDGQFDLNGMLSSIRAAPSGSLAVLQACAHNPSGVDPTAEQWREIFKVCEEKNHTILFDFAYMGYASGDMDTDAAHIREYAKKGKEFFVAFSFSKCMGLYGERIGCLHAVCKTPKEAQAVRSQLTAETRSSISVCPQNGALIAYTVMHDPQLRKEWIGELKQISGRIIDIRGKFVDLLNQKSGKDWEFLRKQRGMFALTGLSREQNDRLANVEGVFLPPNARISVPALNPRNVDFVAQAIANIVKN